MYTNTPTRLIVACAVAALVAAGCGNGDDDNGSADPTTTAESTTAESTTESSTGASTGDTEMADDEMADDEMTGMEGFSEERCANNKEVGTITYLTGFDFAAASSIVEVIYAKDQGLYDELCLDVDIRSSFSTANYGLLASGEGQFASGGSFAEAIAAIGAEGSDLSVVAVDGREAIDTLMLKPGHDSLDSLAGTEIGVKGKLPPSIQVMLSNAGLTFGEDYQTVLLDGFDPTQHYAVETISAFPGWRSNEPGTLERAGLEFTQMDANAAGVPGSFGVIIASNKFIADHPNAAEDFMLATLKGLEMAIEDPPAAAAAAVKMIEDNGNPSFLSIDSETFRWETEAAILTASRPDNAPIGSPDTALLQAELDAYKPTGLFEGIDLPAIADVVNPDLIDAYANGPTVNWPN